MCFPCRFLLLLLVLLPFGCGSRSTATVSGKVLYGSQPLTRGTVTFFVEKGAVVTASIGQDGSYRADKLPVGPAKIAVRVPKNASILPPGYAEKAPEPMRSMANLPKPVPIPDKYGDPDKSGLSMTVEGGQQNHDIVIPK
jgi:hypothetical protein